jgi:hypothetical protein
MELYLHSFVSFRGVDFIKQKTRYLYFREVKTLVEYVTKSVLSYGEIESCINLSEQYAMETCGGMHV